MGTSWLAVLTLGALPCEVARLDASVAPVGPQIVGMVTLEGCTDELHWANYSQILGASPRDDRSEEWHYPRRIDPPSLGVRNAEGPLTSQEGWGESLEHDPKLSFTLRVGSRLGPVGYFEEALAGLGPWHPVFGSPAEGTQSLLWEYTVVVPPGLGGIVGNTLVAPESRRQTIEGSYRGVSVPLYLGRKLRAEKAPGFLLLSNQGREHPLQTPLKDIGAWTQKKALRHLKQTLLAAHQFATEVGLPTPRLHIAVGHLAEYLALPVEGGLMISDRAFMLPPVDKFLDLHRTRIWRTLLAHYSRALLGDTHPTLERRRFVEDILTEYLLDRLLERSKGSQESADAILRRYAIIPQIESLVYAPQIPLRDAYYDPLNEEVPHRHDPNNAFLPADAAVSGRLLFERLVDTYGIEALRQAMAGWLERPSQNPWEALSRSLGADPRETHAPWFAPPVPVDYRIVSKGDRTLEVEALRPAGSEQALPTEKIEVDAYARKGAHMRLTRMGPGLLELPEGFRLKRANLDPNKRLVEVSADAGQNPRFNNTTRPHWRAVFSNFSLNLALTQGEAFFGADFSLRRDYDARDRYFFGLEASRQHFGARLRHLHGFGKQLDALRMSKDLGGWVRGRRFFNEGETQDYSAGAFVRHDDRLANYWTYEGRGAQLSVSGGMGGKQGVLEPYGSVRAALLRVFRTSDTSAMALRIRGERQWGNAPIENQLQLGGRDLGARGYEFDEAYGNQRFILSAEQRHTYQAAARSNLGNALTITRLEGAFFGDASYFPVRREGCNQDTFYSLGYGFRAHYDIGNLSPNTLQLDVGVPLNKCSDSRFDSPVTIYITFWQPFASF